MPARSPDSVKRLTLIACILGSGIVLLDGTVVNVALPTIQRALGGGLAGQQWVVERLPADAGFADPDRRLAGRPLRRAARVRARRRRASARPRLLCAAAPEHRRAGGCPGAAGHGGGAARAQLAGGDRQHVPRGRAGRGDRQLDRLGCDRGSASGRLPAASCWRSRSWRWIFLVNVPLAIVLRDADPDRHPARAPRAAGAPEGRRVGRAALRGRVWAGPCSR